MLLYTIVIRPVKNENGRNTAGEHALETIADTTGGAMYYPDEVPQELDAMFERIDRELRTQYRLGFYPNPRGAAEDLTGQLKVRVMGDYTVRYRTYRIPVARRRGEMEGGGGRKGLRLIFIYCRASE